MIWKYLRIFPLIHSLSLFVSIILYYFNMLYVTKENGMLGVLLNELVNFNQKKKKKELVKYRK